MTVPDFLREYRQLGKIVPEITAIACQEPVRMENRMRANQEIGDDSTGSATAGEIVAEIATRQERTLAG